MRSKVWIAAIAAGVVVIAGGETGWHLYASKAKLAAEAHETLHRAEQNDAVAEAHLGTLYLQGRGVPKDYGKALEWYRRSADQGSPRGEIGLGAAYYHGYGVRQDDAEAMRWYQKAADQGDAAAESIVAYRYEQGIGIERNYAEALRWYAKAAGQGYSSAEVRLGGMYYNGQGVSRDDFEAVQWYRKAADQGDAFGEYDLGFMYFYGNGVPRDRVEANRLFAKAADAGDQSAQRVLGYPLTSSTKLILVIQLAGGILLFSFAPMRLNYLPQPDAGWNGERLATVVAGFFCVLYPCLKWYGYSHLLLRRFGAPLNAFTCVRWVVGSATLTALSYMVYAAWSQTQPRSSFESAAGAEP